MFQNDNTISYKQGPEKATIASIDSQYRLSALAWWYAQVPIFGVALGHLAGVPWHCSCFGSVRLLLDHHDVVTR